jgi:hypothetical protein
MIVTFNVLDLLKGFKRGNGHVTLFDGKMDIFSHGDFDDVVVVRCPCCGRWAQSVVFTEQGMEVPSGPDDFFTTWKAIDENKYKGMVLGK